MSIWTHLISGQVEIATAIVSFFVTDPLPWTYAMATAVVAGHVPSSLYQTPNVFGLKSIMVPAYIFVIGLHLAGGILIFLNPYNPKYVIGTLLIQSIYVYCRIFYFCCTKFNVFGSNKYTISILFSGFLLLPAATECYASNLALIVFVVLANALVYSWVNLWDYEWFITNYWNVENHRDTFGKHVEFTRSLSVTAQIKTAGEDQLKSSGLISDILQTSDSLSLPEQARKVWNEIDSNGDGVITREEFLVMLRKHGMDESQLKIETLWLENIFGDGNEITFPIFYRWFCGGRIAMKQISQSILLPSDLKMQAKIIFDDLDFDSSGFLELWELETLLMNWGVSIKDAKIFLDRWDDGDGKVSFEEFFVHMRRIWEFAISLMIEDGRIHQVTTSSCCAPEQFQENTYKLID